MNEYSYKQTIYTICMKCKYYLDCMAKKLCNVKIKCKNEELQLFTKKENKNE